MPNNSDFDKLTKQTRNLNEELKKLDQQTQYTEKEIDKLNTTSTEVSNSFSETNTEIEKINNQLDTTANKSSILENITSKFGTVVGAASTASGAITNLSNSIKNGSDVFDILTTGVQGAADILATAATGGGIAIASMAVSGFITLLDEVGPTIEQLINPVGQLTEEMENTKQSFDTLKESQNTQLKGDLSNIDYTKKLIEELENLVDENGHVKSGYEERVKYIYDQLKPALGDSIQWTKDENDVISLNSEEIKKNLDLRRAQLILQSKEKSYVQALENIEDANKKHDTSMQKLADVNKEIDDINKKRLFNPSEFDQGELEAAESRKQTILQEMADQALLVQGYQKEIEEYDDMARKIAEGKPEDIMEINNSVVSNYANTASQSIEDLENEVDYTLTYYETLKEKLRDGAENVTEDMVEDARLRWEEATNNLYQASLTSIGMLRDSLMSDVVGEDAESADTLSALGFDLGKSLNENIAAGVFDNINVVYDGAQGVVKGFTYGTEDELHELTPELLQIFTKLGIDCNTSMDNGVHVGKLDAPDIKDLDASGWVTVNCANIQSNFNKPENAIKITAQMGVTAMDVHATNTTGSWTIAVAPHKYTGYASGGFVDKEQLSWIAEGDKPEVVIPLDPGKRTRAMQLFAQTSELLGVSVQARNGFPLGDSLSPSTSVVDYSRLAALITDSLKSSAIQCNPVFQVSQGDVYLDSEKAGRALTPVISRIQAKTAKFETR
ncbi:MAG: hypothetical protein DBX37_05995 [Massilioclostridium sp.]|nr:MAG: hypothetical protein DBX37_05995 [Massilioclostridium sp.]